MPANRIDAQGPAPTDVVALCLRFLGVEPTLHPQFDRSHVRLQDRVQGRLDANNAPKYMVERYARLMREATFPPPLYTGDNVPVDGNTRTRAYIERDVRWIPAYVLDEIKFDGASPEMVRKLQLLSLALNARNGLALDEVELLAFAEQLIEAGSSDEDIVGQTGVKIAKIAALRDRVRAKDRLAHLGFNVGTEALKAAGVTDTALRSFGKPTVMRLDDDMFKGTFELAKEAGLSKAGTIAAIASSINEAPSPESKRERLARERQALQSQITARQNLQTHEDLVGWFGKVIDKVLDKPETSFIENNTEKIAEYIEKLDKLVDKVGEIRDLQAESQPTATAHTVETETAVSVK